MTRFDYKLYLWLLLFDLFWDCFIFQMRGTRETGAEAVNYVDD